MSNDVTEDRIASIFRVEKKSSCKAITGLITGQKGTTRELITVRRLRNTQ
jgi:competence transcription factor ComK